jgi:hypothetical protein
MQIKDLYQNRKANLVQKLTTVLSDLLKYGSMLQEIRSRKDVVSENKEIVKKGISAYFEKVASKIETARCQMMDDVDAASSEDLNKLEILGNTIQTHVHTMKEYISQMRNDDIGEKILFIFYGTCAISDTMPPKCQNVSFSGIAKYSEGTLDSMLTKKLSGYVWNSPVDVKLLEKD